MLRGKYNNINASPTSIAHAIVADQWLLGITAESVRYVFY